MSNSPIKPFILALLAAALSACDRPAFLAYTAIDDSQWERSDAQHFTAVIPADGDYDITLLLRVDRSFPFLSLTVIADETVSPSRERRSTPVTIDIYNDNGTALGSGIGLLNYSAPVSTRRFSRGDTLNVSVRHDMRSVILPGVANVGLRIEKH